MGNCCASRQGAEGKYVVFPRQEAPQALGKYTWTCVWGYRNAAYEALRAAEARRGSPPFLLEIVLAWNSVIPKLAPFMVQAAMQDLYKNDEVLADIQMQRFTLKPELQCTADNPTEFELYSDRIHRMWPGYILDDRCRVRPGPETPTLNLVSLKELLLSSDLDRNAELEWASGKNLRFLDGSDMQGQQVCFQSFPRTGNSFLRRVLELITGNYTGSDMNIDLTLQVQFGNLAGEETVSHDNLTWVTKTHWPAESPLGGAKFSAQKCISIVRNPIDILPSMSYLMNLMSHSHTCVVPPCEVDPVWWNSFVTQMTKCINDSTVELNKQVMPVVPTYYVRYEDLCVDPLPVLTEVFCFLLEVPSIEGTLVEKRIANYCAKGSSAAAVYKVKESSAAGPRNLSRNAHMYTEAQIEMMKDVARDYLYYFNYADNPNGGADANTTFFNYDKETQHDEAKLEEMFGGFKRSNAEALGQVTQTDRTRSSFAFNESYPVDFGMRQLGVISDKLTIKEKV